MLMLVAWSVCDAKDGVEGWGTYVVQPGELARWWVGAHVALEVHVVAFFDVSRRQRAAQPQPHHRRVCVTTNIDSAWQHRIQNILAIRCTNIRRWLARTSQERAQTHWGSERGRLAACRRRPASARSSSRSPWGCRAAPPAHTTQQFVSSCEYNSFTIRPPFTYQRTTALTLRVASASSSCWNKCQNQSCLRCSILCDWLHVFRESIHTKLYSMI